MTMTSVSVIMAVMVINLYNRGSKAVHAPKWVRVLVLEGLSRMLGLKHDMDKLTDNIKLVSSHTICFFDLFCISTPLYFFFFFELHVWENKERNDNKYSVYKFNCVCLMISSILHAMKWYTMVIWHFLELRNACTWIIFWANKSNF